MTDDLVKRAREAAEARLHMVGGMHTVPAEAYPVSVTPPSAALLRELADEVERLRAIRDEFATALEANNEENDALSARLAAVTKAAEPFAQVYLAQTTSALTQDGYEIFGARDHSGRALARVTFSDLRALARALDLST